MTRNIFILVALLIAEAAGLKCYICEGRTRDGKALGSFRSDQCSDTSKIMQNRGALRPCNNFEDVNNQNEIQGKKVDELAFTCVKNIERKPHNEEIVIRRCVAVLKSEFIENGCETVRAHSKQLNDTSGPFAGKTYPENDIEICYCNGKGGGDQDGCNSANGILISFTIVVFAVMAQIM